jgi:hypothetical protein
MAESHIHKQQSALGWVSESCLETSEKVFRIGRLKYWGPLRRYPFLGVHSAAFNFGGFGAANLYPVFSVLYTTLVFWSQGSHFHPSGPVF